MNSNKKLLFYTILGLLFVSILGTLSHFLYEWSGNNKIVGLFSPVNESIWEHIKLFIFPMLIYSFFMSRKLKPEFPCINSALLLGTIVGCLLIPILYYTYTGVIGYDLAAIDIAIFYISVFLAFITLYRFALSCRVMLYEPLFKILIIILVLLILLYTYNPPSFPLFKG